MSELRSFGLAVVLLAAVFWPLERLFAARPGQRWLRPRFLTDLAFMAGQYLLWSTLALAVLTRVDDGLAAVLPASLRSVVTSWPLPVQALLVVLLGDVSVYWFHVASHRVPWLWRFHAVHHSARHLDWLAAHREHPVDGLLTQLAINLPGIALGVDLRMLGALIAFRGLWAIFIHSNVRLPLGPLRVLFGAPELHHWHHLETQVTRHNFANLAPWTDLLFGTYHCPEGPEAWPLGNPGEAPKPYLAYLLEPLGLPSRVAGVPRAGLDARETRGPPEGARELRDSP